MLIGKDKKRPVGSVLLVLVSSGVFGNVVGILLGVLLPEGALNDILSKALNLGIDPPLRINLWVFVVSFGFLLKMNACSFLFMMLGLLLYKKA